MLHLNDSNCQTLFTIKCTCKADESGMCKHGIAVLLNINREGIENLEDLSCTDLKQQRGILKHSALEKYKAKPISETCHVSKEKSDYFCLEEEEATDIRNTLMSAAPNSALTKHRQGRKRPVSEILSSTGREEIPIKIKALFDQAEHSLEDFNKSSVVYKLCDYCSEIYEYISNTNSVNLCCQTITQGNGSVSNRQKWLQEKEKNYWISLLWIIYLFM